MTKKNTVKPHIWLLPLFSLRLPPSVHGFPFHWIYSRTDESGNLSGFSGGWVSGPKYGSVSLTVYALVGAAGAPVFAGFRAASVSSRVQLAVS